MNKQVVGVQNADILAEIIRPHAFYATKEEWTDLPPKTYTIKEYRLTPEMNRMYVQMERDFVLWLEDGGHVSVEAAISKYIKLAQIQNGFIIQENGEIEELVTPSNNPRIKLIKELLENEITGKVVIPYFHRYMYTMLSRELNNYNPAYIQGGVKEGVIEEQKYMFNNDSSCRVILVQLTAGRYGHTLLGGPEPKDRCSTMLFAESTYSLDTRSQIEDRIHRIGQTSNNCLYIDLAGTPLDKRVIMALQAKEQIYQTVFKAIKERQNEYAG